MSPTTDAHDRLVTSQARWTGLSCVATIGTMSAIPCVVGMNAFGDVLLPGGVGESGSQMLAIKKSLLTDYADTVKYPNGEPPKFTPVTVRGQDHVILDVDERDGIFYITVGDPTASE